MQNHSFSLFYIIVEFWSDFYLLNIASTSNIDKFIKTTSIKILTTQLMSIIENRVIILI